MLRTQPQRARDLLYRDEAGGFVVVDYKSDRTRHVAGSAELTRYLRQGALYCQAIAEAFGAENPPRFEIWWLRHGTIDVFDSPANAAIEADDPGVQSSLTV